MDENYKKQVSLLLEVLPFVAEEENLALHGGTAKISEFAETKR